jgi:gamma-glutamylcyclotransferase (GGCT)/AIG2-like uncharacterized protein YtfP
MNGSVLAHRLGRSDALGFERRLGVLRDHRLVFSKVCSTDDRIGYAAVIPAHGHAVEGVLCVLDQADIARLDAIELVPDHYTRGLMFVHDRLAGHDVEAHVYCATQRMIRPNLVPPRDYIERMLGARDLLTSSYVRNLKKILCFEDG